MTRIWNWIKRFFGIGQNSGEVVLPVDPPDVSGPPGFYLGKVKGIYPSEAQMVKDAVALVEKVVRSPYFQDEVMRTQFTSTNGKTNAGIYVDFTQRAFIVNVAMFTGSWFQNKRSKTIGYDNADEYVHANRYFIKTSEDLGSLVIHECAHSIGYSHKKASEKTSVPYAMNKIFETVLEKIK